MQFDCTRCEELLLDFAYGELDEVTAAAFRRHADSCARCGASLADVRVVREAFSFMPLETPSPTVDARILAAADARLNELDDKKRALQRDESRSILGKIFDVFRVVAVRPQYAMAMILVLVVGIGLYVAPEGRLSEQAAPGVAPSLVGERPVEVAPAPPAVTAAEPDGFADATTAMATPTTPGPAAPAAEENQARHAARGGDQADLEEGRRVDVPARPEAAPAKRAPERGLVEGALAESSRDRDSQPVVVTQAPARASLRGEGGGGLDEDTDARLGFTQTPREAERQRSLEGASDDVLSRGQGVRREARAYAPPPPAPADQPFARAPSQPSAPVASVAQGSMPLQQQGQSMGSSSMSAPSAGGVAAPADASVYDRGMRSYRAGQYRAAIPDLQQAIARPGLTNDALATAHHAIARSFMRTGNYAEAARRYEELMRRFAAFRTNAEVNYDAAECYRNLGNTSRADELYRVAERSAQYGERARARRVQMDGARRAAPAFDAAEEAVEASPPEAAAAH